jgi:hypothetical protein
LKGLHRRISPKAAGDAVFSVARAGNFHDQLFQNWMERGKKVQVSAKRVMCALFLYFSFFPTAGNEHVTLLAEKFTNGTIILDEIGNQM